MARWADLLVDYCLRVAPGETVSIGAELEARPLVEACYRAVVLRGAHPLVRIDLPGLAEFFLRNATDDQLAHLPPVGLYEADDPAALHDALMSLPMAPWLDVHVEALATHPQERT